MTYTLQEQYTSKNQVAGSAADSVWHRGARKVSTITIHWWGNKGQQFGTVRDFLCTNDTPTSAHYVVQDGLVACIVSPDDCAFHAGNAEGNSHSIGIECRPEATDGDYATIAELIRYLRSIYGDIPLVPHNNWYSTACPGDYDLDRLDSLARGGTITTQSATITPEDDEMALTPTFDTDVRGSLQNITDNINGLASFQRDVRADLSVKAQQIAALTAANGQLVELLASSKSLSVDDIRTALTAAIADGIKVTVEAK